jgi:hypothetical protein
MSNNNTFYDALGMAARRHIYGILAPYIENVEQLIADTLTADEFNTMIKILNSAADYIDQHNIKTKKIYANILVPFLIKAPKEEASMQSKWTFVLINTLTSDKNITTDSHSMFLSQISIEDFVIFDKICKQCTTIVCDGLWNVHVKLDETLAIDKLIQFDKQANIVVDHLIALGLVIEVLQEGEESRRVTLSDFGFSFMVAKSQ